MSESEQQIREHNARQSWLDVANHLTVAYEAVEQAQGSLSDLGLDSLADQLDAVHDVLRRAASDAREASTPE